MGKPSGSSLLNAPITRAEAIEIRAVLMASETNSRKRWEMRERIVAKIEAALKRQED